MASPKPGFDAIGNRRNSRFVPSTDNDVAQRLKNAIVDATIAFFPPATIMAGTASGILTASANPANTNTVTINGKVYTFQTTLTDVDGNVHIGAAATDTLDNLIAAINLGAGAGTDYATSMTLHPTVTGAAGAGDTMAASAKVGGTAGNALTTTEAGPNTSWAAATLLGGLAAPANALTELEVGDAIEVIGTVGQNGSYVVATVLAGVITTVEQTLTAEGVGASVTVRSTNNRNLNRFAT